MKKMSDITKLKDANTEPVPEVINHLERALEMARAGELRTVTIVGDVTGNGTFTAFYTSDTPRSVGQLAILQHTICAHHREGREDQ